MKELLKLFTNCKGQGHLTRGANRQERRERTQDLLYFIWWVLLTSTQSISLPGKFFHQLNNSSFNKKEQMKILNRILNWIFKQ